MDVINYLKRNNGSGHIVEHVGWHESGDYLLRQLFSNLDKGYRQHKYDVEKEYDVVDKSEVDLLERHTCPSRINDFGPWEKTENMDFWQDRGGDRCCSFCGSYNPEDLLSLISKEGMSVVENTTKSYKRYIKTPNNPMVKFYVRHFTQDQIDQFNAFIANSY